RPRRSHRRARPPDHHRGRRASLPASPGCRSSMDPVIVIVAVVIGVVAGAAIGLAIARSRKSGGDAARKAAEEEAERIRTAAAGEVDALKKAAEVEGR